MSQSTPKPRWFTQPEMIIALSALVVSLVTTAVSVYSAYIDREYAKASVWPQLEILHNDGNNLFELIVTNRGNGPALVKYATVKYQDQYFKSWRDIDDLDDFTASFISRRTISPNQSVTTIGYRGDKVAPFLDMARNMDFSLCYCSIYNQCWLTRYGGDTKSVQQCDISPQHAFTH